ncbi:hypothetical protein [Nocardia sp. NPDC052316]|uniref:hypothetical protein n=1 Tax=Nocardia sp. NPDC052316 TaxID=3364329 RepID=UPI0037CB161A
MRGQIAPRPDVGAPPVHSRAGERPVRPPALALASRLSSARVDKCYVGWSRRLDRLTPHAPTRRIEKIELVPRQAIDRPLDTATDRAGRSTTNRHNPFR